MTEAWAAQQRTLVLAAFVAGCTIAEMQLRLLTAAMNPMASIKPPRSSSPNKENDYAESCTSHLE